MATNSNSRDSTASLSSGDGDDHADAADLYARYRAAVARTDALIEGGQTPVGKSPAEIRARAEHRVVRVRRFLAVLGNPQDAYAIVHVAGTSGKGSTVKCSSRKCGVSLMTSG